ncbi:hypothetical protein [Alloscardovia omnicolens]
MGKATVKLDLNAFKAIRQSSEVQAVLDREAQKIAERANSMSSFKYAPVEYKAVPARATDKGSVALVTTQGNLYATLDNAQNNTLRKAIQTGG